MKLETVKENVLWNMLLEKQTYINGIINGTQDVSDNEIAKLLSDVEINCNNYFFEETSMIVYIVYEGAPDLVHIEIYNLDNATGELILLETLPIDTNLKELELSFLNNRYKVRFFSKYEHNDFGIEIDTNYNVIEDSNGTNSIIVIRKEGNDYGCTIYDVDNN